MVASVPVPPLDDAGLPFPDGDVFAFAVPTGEPLGLHFPSPYEAWLTVGGVRVSQEVHKHHRPVLLWLGRRLPALMRALSGERGLVGAVTAQGVVVTDVVALDGTSALDHGALASLLEPAQVELPAFAPLGHTDGGEGRAERGAGRATAQGGRGEWWARARATWAAGTLVEVRVEREGFVVARQRLRLGRA